MLAQSLAGFAHACTLPVPKVEGCAEWFSGGGGAVVLSGRRWRRHHQSCCFTISSPYEMWHCGCDVQRLVGYALYTATMAVLSGTIANDRGTIANDRGTLENPHS